jgi:CTP:molybdopterin cytidylyltransferase MocA
MGRAKQLLVVAGRPLLETVVAAACASRLDDVVVVLGANADAIRGEVALGRARVVINAAFASGMSSSLRAGLHALGQDVERVAVILGDQPSITARLLDDLLEAHASGGRPAAALSVGGLLHPPAVLSRELWDGVASLQGDVGFRAFLRPHPELVTALPAQEEDSNGPLDIDTPEDYRRWAERE